MRPWNELPENMKNDAVRRYYTILEKHRAGLAVKRVFDIFASLVLIVVLSPVLLILSLMIKLDSRGPVLFRQVRVTRYGEEFRICKFRTMVNDAEKQGTQVTTKNDSRVTRVGKLLRGCRLDELPQLFNVLKGEMTFVGTRPEVVKYVNCYTEEMVATLLLPAGITSKASIEYKDEEKLLENADDADRIYVEKVLPDKMKYNLESLEEFSVLNDLKTMILTVVAVVK